MAAPLRILTALVAAAALLVGLAACSGGGGEDRTEGLGPAQILERSAEAARGLRAYRIDLRGEVETTLSPAGRRQAQGPAGLLEGPVPFSGAGPILPPDRFSLDLTAEPRGLAVQANLTRVGDDLFLSTFGRDFALQVPPAGVRVLDARRLFPSVAGWIADPRDAGREDVGGQETVRISGRVDADRVAGDLAVLLGAAPGVAGGAVPTPAEVRRAAAALRPQLSGSEVTVWVRTSDLRPARVRVALALTDASPLAPQLERLRLDMTLDLSDYDEDLEVSAPSDPQPLRLDALTGLVGG
ncbi:MAG TPA: hypothetical protein VNT51_05050 [Miltoncostaeaceae bacterium]|nr:hypothetical protein [Miltoncostaeaceae bacterium]